MSARISKHQILKEQQNAGVQAALWLAGADIMASIFHARVIVFFTTKAAETYPGIDIVDIGYAHAEAALAETGSLCGNVRRAHTLLHHGAQRPSQPDRGPETSACDTTVSEAAHWLEENAKQNYQWRAAQLAVSIAVGKGLFVRAGRYVLCKKGKC